MQVTWAQLHVPARCADSCLVLGLAYLLTSCVVEPSVRPRQDAQHARDASLDAWLDAWLDAGLDADAGICPISREDAMACDAIVPKASDASLDPGDATCIHPQVVEDCAEGWCRIPAGCFVAGAPESEACSGPSSHQVQVFLTRPFLILQTEVTQEMWAEQGFPNPARPEACSDCPVNMVNLYEAFAYANALSEIEALEPCYELGCCVGQVGTGCPERCHPCDDIQYTCPDEVHRYARRNECPGYRLPTGPEWEYAARAGTTTATYNGDVESSAGCVSDPVVDPIAWHCGNADRPMPVGLLMPNGWGLYNMLGNLGEYVDYRYDGFDLEHGEGRSGPLVDPVGPGCQAWGIEIRGGCYLSYPCYSRASNHVGAGLDRFIGFGFRVVRTIFE